MTIASEITRLQNDKAAMCTAIENKGVTVGNVTLDSYAACIDAIEQGSGGIGVDILMIGGGGNGGYSNCGSSSGGGGGGAGQVIQCSGLLVSGGLSITVGCCGSDVPSRNTIVSSQYGDMVAIGGGDGGNSTDCTTYRAGDTKGRDGGSGGGGGGFCSCGGTGILGYNGGGKLCAATAGGGGGGAGGAGLNGCCTKGGCGGLGIQSDIEGELKCYAGGGGGGGGSSSSCRGLGCYGGGDGGYGGGAGANATTCGSGGGGGRTAGCGGAGLVVIRYPTSCGYNIAGGHKYTCGDYTIHCFNSDGVFSSNYSPDCKLVQYLVVGGGGSGGARGGGGGGDVIMGISGLSLGQSYPISIGCGGTNGQGGTTSEFNGICAKGGQGGCEVDTPRKGGCSGSGCSGGLGPTNCAGGGGGGAGGNGEDGHGTYCGGNGGKGKYGYGGGGGGGYCIANGSYCFGIGVDGGGHGQQCKSTGCDATNYGGGGGGLYWSTCCPGKGYQGVVDICYPSDGSYGFTTATGGDSCYTCNGMCVHRFTSNGTFTIVS